MSYENPVIKMYAENVEHNHQAVHVTCHCQRHWEIVKAELDQCKKLYLENNQLLKSIHQQMLLQEPDLTPSSASASPGFASESESLDIQNLLISN